MALLVPPPLKRAAIGSKRKLQGVAFLVMIGLLFYLVIALYNKSFVKTVPISLRTDSIGNQLSLNADVKFRGVNVGQVKSLSTTGEVATLKLAMIPDQIKLIPSNVHGAAHPQDAVRREVRRADPAGRAGTASRCRPVTRSRRPTCRSRSRRCSTTCSRSSTTVDPANLSYTLSAVSSALEGRGNELGETLVTLNSYLQKTNPRRPAAQCTDVTKLAEGRRRLADVAARPRRLLRNTVVTGNTIVAKKAQLRRSWTTPRVVRHRRTFLEENGDDLIGLAGEPADRSRWSLATRPDVPLPARRLVDRLPCLGARSAAACSTSTSTLIKQPRGTTGRQAGLRRSNGPYCAGLRQPGTSGGPRRRRQSRRASNGCNGVAATATASAGTGRRRRGNRRPSSGHAGSPRRSARSPLPRRRSPAPAWPTWRSLRLRARWPARR